MAASWRGEVVPQAELAIKTNPEAAPGNVIPALASLLLQIARRNLAERAVSK
jgi:hypothetical protein